MRQVEMDEAEIVLGQIKAAQFSYAIASDDKKSWSWKNSMSKETNYDRLGAISIQVLPENPTRSNRPTKPIQRTFYLARYHPLESTLDSAKAAA